MSPQQIVTLGARLLAVWLFAQLPGQAYQFYTLIVTGFSDNSAHLRVFAASALLIEVLLILALWFFPLRVAQRLLRSSSAARSATSSPDIWLGMGCALIGLWLLANNLPGLVLKAYILIGAGNSMETGSLKQGLFHDAAEVAIGLWLILGASGFREVFWWAQKAGLNKPTA